jgi:hypothetical protein
MNSFDAPSSALLLGMTPPALRGTVYALFHLAVGLVAGLGPWLVGSLSDLMSDEGGANHLGKQQSDAATSESGVVKGASAVGLQRALMLMQLVNLWAALHFCLAACTVREELQGGSQHSQHLPEMHKAEQPAAAAQYSCVAGSSTSIKEDHE